MSATVPTAAIGYTQAPNYQWWYDAAETTPELQWPQSIYVYDQMRRTDAQCTSVLRAVTLPVRRTPWRIDPNGARPEVVKLVADDLGLPVAGENEVRPPLRSKGRFSWSEHLRLALLMLPFGHSYFEQLYRVDDDGGRAHLGKLEFRPPTTIEKIEVATDGGLVYIQQYWTATNTEPRPIPVDRLVAYVNEREGGNWLGTSLLRSAYKNWLLKDRLLRVQAQTIERNGMGIPVYEGAENEQDLSVGKAVATSLRSGPAAGAATPFGAKLRLMGVEGTLPNAEPAVRYHDEQIARAVLAHFLNLGTQTGSWALGSTFADFFTLSLQTLAQQIASTTTQHVIEDLVDVNWGPDEPAPRLCFDEIGSRQAATAEALKSLVDAGILHPDEPLEGATRQFYGLPPADPATATPPPGGAPTATPDAPTQTGEYSVAASRRRVRAKRRPRRPVRAKFDPLQKRDDHGRWSALGGLALETLTRKFGDVLESAKWGDHGDGKLGGWISLHADGNVVLSHRSEDGDAKPMLDGADIDQPSEWRGLAGNLRDAADAAEAKDEDYEAPNEPGYEIEVDPEDGTASFNSDSRPRNGVIAEPSDLRSMADGADEFADHLGRYQSGGYDEPDGPDVEAPAVAESDTFRPGGDSDAGMDWSIVKKNGSRVFELTGDNGDSIAPWLSPEEFTGLRDALADAASGGGTDHFYPNIEDDEDNRYFSWTPRTGADGQTLFRIDVADEEGDEVRFTLTPQEMRGWLDAMSATLGGKVAASAGVDLDDEASWVAAAAGVDTHPGGERLKRWWVYGAGAARWSTWTQLYDELKEHIKNVKKLKATVSAWYRLRYGHNPPRHHVAASALTGSDEAMLAYAEEFGEPDDGDDEAADWELQIDALSAALDELSGAVVASFNPRQPRNPKGGPGGGRFRSTVDRLKDALTEHRKSGGKGGDPFEGFDREQLRRAAVKQGISLERKESRDSIARKLTDHIGPAKSSPRADKMADRQQKAGQKAAGVGVRKPSKATEERRRQIEEQTNRALDELDRKAADAKKQQSAKERRDRIHERLASVQTKIDRDDEQGGVLEKDARDRLEDLKDELLQELDELDAKGMAKAAPKAKATTSSDRFKPGDTVVWTDPVDGGAQSAKIVGADDDALYIDWGHGDAPERLQRDDPDIDNFQLASDAPQAPGKPEAPKGPPPVPQAPEPVKPGERGDVVSSRPLAGGASATSVDLVTYADGSQSVRKQLRDLRNPVTGVMITDVKHQADAEELGSLVAGALGIPAPGVRRTSDDEIEMDYVEGTVGMDLYGQTESVVSRLRTEDQAVRLGLFDAITDNMDRNAGNWILAPDGRVVSIDHSLSWAFYEKPPGEAPKGSGPFVDLLREMSIRKGVVWRDTARLSPADVEQTRARLEALRPEFEARGRTDWLEASLTRLDGLAPHAKGTGTVLA